MARGSIRQRSRGSWTITWDAPRKNGKRQQRTLTIQGTKKQAQAELTAILSSVNRGTYVEPSREDVATYLRRWLERIARPGVRHRTYCLYRAGIEGHLIPAFGDLPLSRLTADDIEAWYARTTLAPSTARLYGQVLRMALREAVARDLLSRDPSARVKLPRVGEGPGRALSLEELREVFAALSGSWVRVPALIALGTGLRPGEILSLRWVDVDLETGSISVTRTQTQGERGMEFAAPKTKGSRRSVGIGTNLVEALREHRQEQAEHVRRAAEVWKGCGLVVCRGDGLPWTVSAMSHAWKRLVHARESTVESTRGARFYDLRHSANSYVLAGGVEVLAASKRMGHARASMTLDRYAHLIPGRQDAAVEVADAVVRAALRQSD